MVLRAGRKAGALRFGAGPCDSPPESGAYAPTMQRDGIVDDGRRFRGTGWLILLVAVLCLTVPTEGEAQFVTVGAGALFTKDNVDPVVELLVTAPPLVYDFRPYLTTSWVLDEIEPTFISAAERPIWRTSHHFTSLGAGVLWLQPANYTPYPILVSTTAVFPPIPRTMLVGIGSVQPFQDWSWSIVAKVAVMLVAGK
jgi:hypothetical protein